jgi:WD40 repeat protein
MKNYVIVIFFILAIIENGRAIDYSFIDVGLGRVQTFDISPDEKILAMGSNSGIIALYDIEKSKYLKIFAPQPFSAIFSLEFDATGKYLASSGTDKKMRVWDIEGDSLLKQIK